MTFNPKLDLKLERVVPVSPDKIYRAWTTPEHLKQWFCPKPWQTTECEMDLRPGGVFRTVMEGPNGERFNNAGCFLELVPPRRIVWTNALEPGFRPAVADKSAPVHFFFTATLTFEPQGAGTKYTAIVQHANESDAAQHATMGFDDGWGTVLNQLVEILQREK